VKPLRHQAAVVLSIGAIALGACASEPSFNGTELTPPIPAPELAGVNWDGEPFALSQLRGRLAVIFFGYTYCPDVCPMTLGKLKQVSTALDDAAEDVEVVFVSVDPGRDTVERLAAYVPNFDRRFFGLHLEAGALDVTREALGLMIEYGEPLDDPGADGFYYVDHTSSYFVVDRLGRARLLLSRTLTPEEILADLRALLAEST
jgi:protein SCO1/2